MRARDLLIATAVVVASLAGCALAPPPAADDIRKQALPNVVAPPAWTAKGGAQGTVADNWLATFGSAQLDALVREALAYNTDLAVAAARVEQAAAYAKLAGSTLYPSLNFGAHGGGKTGGDGSGLNMVGLFANWEIDLWGRVRSGQEAARLQYESTVADTEYARQSIAAIVAKSWTLAIETKMQGALAADIVRYAEQALGLARDRLRVGKGDEYDVAQAQANLENARDVARQVALAYEQALRALETLVGRYPAAAVEVATALPAFPGSVPVGLPSELLERRPDVIAAERRVAAAFNLVQEAKAAELPRISLTASVSSITSDLFVLKDRSNPSGSFGATLTAPLFNGFALKTQVEIKTAEQKIAVADYGRIGARAFGEVEAALSAGFAADEREAILQRSVASNAKALELAQVRYRVGSGDLRAVMAQSVALAQAHTALLRAQSERLMQRVNLHLALGGSFEPRPAAANDAKTANQAGATLAFVRAN